MGRDSWWRRRRRRRRAGDAGRPRSPAEELRAALEELRERKERRRRTRRGKRRHVDDYRELVIEGDRRGALSDALLNLTAESHRNRRLLLAEEKRRTELPAAQQSGTRPEDAQAQARRAADELREDMRRRGVRERTHYYSASERSETGEVDRTYHVDTEE